MSANVIDSLVVELGIDSKKFMRGLNDAASAMNGAKRALLEFAAAAGGAAFLVSMTEKVTQLNADLGLFTHNLDISIEKTNFWSNAVRSFGGSAQGFQGTIAGLTMEFEKLQLTGDSSLLPILNKFADLDRTDPFKFLEGLKEKIDYINDPRQSKMLLDMLHIDTGTQNMMLNTTAEKFSALIAEQQRKNQVDKESAKASQELREKYVNFQTSLEAIYTKFVNEISPGLTKGFEYITESISYLVGHKEAIEAFFGAIAVAIGIATLPMIAGVAPVLILAGAIALLTDDFLTWKEGGKSFIDWDSWKEQLDGAIEKIDGLKNKIKEIIEYVDKINNFEIFGISLKDIKDFQFGVASGAANTMMQGWGAIANSAKKDVAWIASGYQQASNAVDNAVLPILGKAGSWFSGTELFSRMTKAEGGYNSVNYGKKFGGKSGTEDLSNKSIEEVLSDLESKKYNTAGKYQTIASTLKMAIKGMNINPRDAMFTPEMQDEIGEWILENKQPELKKFFSGRSNDLFSAALGLSKEWASFANPFTGKSFYDGIQGNKASVTPQESMRMLQEAKARKNMLAMVGISSANAEPAMNNKNNFGSTSSNEISIGQISIQTNATDAQGIAKDIGREIINIADTGMCL